MSNLICCTNRTQLYLCNGLNFKLTKDFFAIACPFERCDSMEPPLTLAQIQRQIYNLTLCSGHNSQQRFSFASPALINHRSSDVGKIVDWRRLTYHHDLMYASFVSFFKKERMTVRDIYNIIYIYVYIYNCCIPSERLLTCYWPRINFPGRFGVFSGE